MAKSSHLMPSLFADLRQFVEGPFQIELLVTLGRREPARIAHVVAPLAGSQYGPSNRRTNPPNDETPFSYVQQNW